MTSTARTLETDLAETLAELRRIAGQQTELVSIWRGLQVNAILWSGTAKLDSNGVYRKSFQVPAAAIFLCNRSGSTMTITAGGGSDSPGTGPGTITVPAGATCRRNLACREITIIGAAGAACDLEVASRPYAPEETAATTVTGVNNAATETTTPLAGGATFAGKTYDTLDATVSTLRIFAVSDQAGTIGFEESMDGSAWYESLTQPAMANSPTSVEAMITCRYVRAFYTNGATGQGSFLLVSRLVA